MIYDWLKNYVHRIAGGGVFLWILDGQGGPVARHFRFNHLQAGWWYWPFKLPVIWQNDALRRFSRFFAIAIASQTPGVEPGALCRGDTDTRDARIVPAGGRSSAVGVL